jgi:hypothetical protein
MRALLEAVSGPPAAPSAPQITGPNTVSASSSAGQFQLTYSGTAPITFAIAPAVSGVSVNASGVVSYPANFAGSITSTATNTLGTASQTTVVSQPAVVLVSVLDSALSALTSGATSKTAQLQAIINRVPTKAVFSGSGVARCEHVVSASSQSNGELILAFGAVTGLTDGAIDKMTLYAGAAALLEHPIVTFAPYQTTPAGMKIDIMQSHRTKASAGLPL